jgi:ATP-dependent RNA helicase RhlE
MVIKAKAGNIPVLVATDIAARGLDIDQLPQVVNFELPNVPEDYVHRIGRTGRAGSSGAAISLVDFEEAKYLKDIEKLIKREITKVAVDGFEAPTKLEPEAPRGLRNQPPRNKSAKPQQQRRPQGSGGQKQGQSQGQGQGQKKSQSQAPRQNPSSNQARQQPNGSQASPPVHHTGNRGK